MGNPTTRPEQKSTRSAIRWIILLACVLGLWFAFRRGDGRSPDPAGIVLQVRRLSTLSTVRYTVQKIVTLEEQKQPVGSERILLVVQARVEAGINLAELQQRDVERRSDGTVVIRLPQAQILNASIDEKETRVWDRSKTWWTPWVPYSNDLEKKARMMGLDAARQSAIEMGILRQAETGASEAIRSLLALAGIRKVEIIPGSAS